MKKIIIILIIVLLAWGGFWYFNTRPKKVENGTVETASYKPFFPFGKTISVGTDTDTNTDTQDSNPSTNSEDSGTSIQDIFSGKSNLRQITKFQVAGFATFIDTRPIPTQTPQESAPLPTEDIPEKVTNSKIKEPVKAKVDEVVLPTTEQVPSLRYVQRSNGHIYGEYLDTKSGDKISDATIPVIYEAVWGNNGNSVIYRYLNSDNKIQSFIATLGGQNGEFLPEGIEAITPAPFGNQFFYLAPLGTNIAGYISSFTENKKTQVFNSPFTEWIPQWVGKSTIYLTTKASWDTEGYMYILNITNGTFSKILGGVKGFTTLSSPLGVSILYSSVEDGALNFKVFNLKTNTSDKLDVTTLPEKCTWSNDNITIYCGVPQEIAGSDYPDKWYQGRVFFSDKIVRIDTSTGQTETLTSQNNFDAVNLSLSSDEKTLIFINKRDSTLWGLDLN